MIRKAVFEKDCDILYNLVKRAYASKNADRYREIDSKSEKFRSELQHFYIYEEDDVMIGCVKCVVENEVVDIGPLAVDPKHQHKGVGSEMLKFSATLAPVQTLMIFEYRTDLIAYYKKRGFREVKRSPIKEVMKKNHVLGVKHFDVDVIYFERRS